MLNRLTTICETSRPKSSWPSWRKTTNLWFFTARGVHGGTYGGKFVAYDYAAWLNPGFKYAAYKVLDDYFTGELQHRNSLSAQLNMKCHEFDQKKDMASFCGQGLAAWRYTKPVLVAEINSLANQLQITIPGLPG